MWFLIANFFLVPTSCTAQSQHIVSGRNIKKQTAR